MNAFTLESADSFGGVLHGLVHLPARPGRRPTVVICHGFKGFMEWGFFPPLAELLCERGFTVIRFNYSGSGMKPGDELVTDLEAFKRNTFSLELAETLKVLESAPDLAPGRVDLDRMALLGHSRGGGAAILAAAAPALRTRLRALVTWAAVATFDRYGLEMRQAWRRDGALPMKNGRTGQELELGRELLDDIEGERQRLDLEKAAGDRKAPWLIVHGAADETVPMEEARTLQSAAQRALPHAEGRAEGRAEDEVRLEAVAGGSHTFGARHPFLGPTRELIQAMNATQRWLRRHLG